MTNPSTPPANAVPNPVPALLRGLQRHLYTATAVYGGAAALFAFGGGAAGHSVWLWALLLAPVAALAGTGLALGRIAARLDLTLADAERAHQVMVEREFRYRDLFNRVPTPVLLHRVGEVLEVNLRTAEIMGYDGVEQMRGVNLIDAHVPVAERQAMRERLTALLSLPPNQNLPIRDLTLVTRQGRTLVFKAMASTVLHDGQPALMLSGIDDTERLAATAALEHSQALLQRLISVSPDAIALTSEPGGVYEMVNASFTRLLGYEASEVLGRSSSELSTWRHPEDRARVGAALVAEGKVSDWPIDFVDRQGGVVPLMISAAVFENKHRMYVLVTARDVSEATRARLEREAVLAHASVGIALTRQDRFVFSNEQFNQLVGWTGGSLAGQAADAVWRNKAEFGALTAISRPRLERGEAVDVERPVTRLDGSRMQMRIRARVIDPGSARSGGTIWIVEDTTTSHAAALELARARDAAEMANRAKSAFLANTSHEIRTPLNGLLGLARLARQPDVSPQRLRQYIDLIGESAEVLGMIISDILDVSKIEAGKLDLESAPFELGLLLRSLQQAYSELASTHGLVFEGVFDNELPAVVRGDALRVRQILVNFLHNALKFTAQGSVRLVVHPMHGDWVRFEVHDTGPGIDEAGQRRLFQPFTQVDETTTRRYGGTGLGLSICRELAALMGGHVGLLSQPGQGSCFYAELPLPAVDMAPAAMLANGAPDLSPLIGLRVLVAEDNSVNMMIAVAMLEAWGVQVYEAHDGAEAVTAVQRMARAGQPVDLVLMDVQMPGMSGYEATAQLREQFDRETLPVIALTAAALVSERERAQLHGMTGFLTKPVDPLRLQASLLQVARERQARLQPHST